MKKQTLLLLLCFMLMLSTTLVLASCGGRGDGTTTATTTTAATTTAHQHVYSHSTVAPTCTEDGYDLHQCACGHSYRDNPVAASHSLSSKIVRYPTTMIEGARRFICSECDYTRTEPIAVVTTVTLPSVAEAIAASLPDGTFEIADLASLPSIALFSTYAEEHDGAPYLSTSSEDYYALKIADLTLTVDGTDIEGHLALEIGTADLAEGQTTTEDFTKIFSIDLYMVGDALSVAVNGPDADELNLSDAFYAALAKRLHISVSSLVEIFYVSGELESYLPVAEAIANAIAAEVELPTAEYGIADFIALLGKDLVVTEADGDNTVYTVDVASVVDALAAYADKTVADAIDAAYGDGTATALMAYLVRLPDMKLGDIADAAILLAETYEIDADLVYALINRIVYLEAGTDFDIELAIFERYDATLAEVVSELSGTPAQTLKDSVVALTAMLTGNTFAEWYHVAYCDPTVDPHNQSTCEALAELLADASASLDEVTITATKDAEGNTLSYEVSCPLFGIVSDAEGISGEAYLPGFGQADFSLDGTAFVLTVVDLENAENKYVDITATLDNGLVTSIDVQVSGWCTVPGEEGDEPTEEFCPVLDATLDFMYDGQYDVICTAVVDLPMPVKVVVGIRADAVSVAYGAKDSVEPDGSYTLTYTPAEDGFSIVVTDVMADAALGSLTYTENAVTGDASVVLVTPFGEFGLAKVVGQDATVYKVTTVVEEEEIVLGSLTLGQTLVIDMNNPILAGKIEITPDAAKSGFAVTFTEFSITHGYADQYTNSGEGENGEKVEITVDTYAQDVAVLNGTLSFVYTAPIE